MRAIGRLFKAIWYLITGRIDKARMALEENPGVISAKYDDVIREKTDRIHRFKDAVAGLIQLQEADKIKLVDLTREITRLSDLQRGATIRAQKVASKYNDDKAAAQADPEFQKCMAAFRDFTSTLAEKEKRVRDLETAIGQRGTEIGKFKISLESELRNLDHIKQEKHETIADVISAKEQLEISNLLSGISQDSTGLKLQELRDVRNKVKAQAKVGSELSGLDSKQAEADFLADLETSTASTEFDLLVFGSKNTEVPDTVEPGKLPE